MNTNLAIPLKSTIVRFMLLALVGIILPACASVTPRLAQQAPCAVAATLICEDFGSQSRCRCTDATAVERQVAGLGHNAAIGRGW
jgi:hypothetical protein